MTLGPNLTLWPEASRSLASQGTWPVPAFTSKAHVMEYVEEKHREMIGIYPAVGVFYTNVIEYMPPRRAHKLHHRSPHGLRARTGSSVPTEAAPFSSRLMPATDLTAHCVLQLLSLLLASPRLP